MDKYDQTKEFFLYEEMKKGKEYAFDFFFNYYYPGLCVYVQKIISLPDQEARDIVQDTFIKFWNDREKLNVQYSVRSYLFISVRNRCLDILRKKDKNIRVYEIPEEYDVPEESFDTFVFSELETIFSDSLKKLPERCREVFELSRLHGLKNKEISLKLNISEKTVENQVTKALHILKDELKDYLPLLVLFEYFSFFR